MNLSKYIQLWKISFREAKAYRLDAINTLAGSIILLILYYFLWGSIAASGELRGGFSQVMTYLVLGQVVSAFAFVNPEKYVGEKVRKGTVVNDLKRPVSFFHQVQLHDAGWASFNLLTKSVPLLGLGILFFGVEIIGFTNLVLFSVSLFLSLVLVSLAGYVTSMLVFWTKVDWSVRMMRNTLQQLFSGAMFPLYLLPPYLEPVFNALPFQAMVDFPIRIYMMEQGVNQALRLIGIQFVWILILLTISLLAWRKAKSKLTVQGG